MTQQAIVTFHPNQPVTYDVTEEQIDLKRQTYAAIDPTAPGGYEACRLAIADCRETRVAVEARRTALKEPALKWGRDVDAAAKKLTALIVEIETPLQEKKAVIDAAKAKAKREKEEAERAALEAQIRAEKEAEEARQAAIRAAEEARLAAIAEQQRAEAAKLAQERAALDAQRIADEQARQRQADEQARQLQAAREVQEAALAAERAHADMLAREEAARLAQVQRKLDEDRRALEIAQAQEQARRDEVARAEAARVQAEQARVEEAERLALLRARLDALRPDAERLHQYASEIRALPIPRVTSEEARVAVARAVDALADVAGALERFGNVEEVAA